MTKRKRAPLAVGGLDDKGTEDEDADDRPRPAPNTNFLVRLVRGVATGNQRQIDTTTSNAANLSIGATGAASLRLQLQRAANAKTAQYQTLRRVVLSSAEKQRLTLCTALMAEVAQGFGFRLTVRQPDGQEIGARDAMEAAEQLDRRQKAQAAARLDASGKAGDAGKEDPDAAEGGTNGAEDAPVSGAAAAAEGHLGIGPGDGFQRDPLEALEPLHVDLDMDHDGKGLLLQMLQHPQSPAGGRMATRLARSPSGARRPGSNALLSGRLMSAALGSMGLMGVKKTAAAQALQTARRRALLRAASSAGADEVGAAADAMTANAVEPGKAAPALAEDAAAGTCAVDANEAGAGASSKPTSNTAASGRRIVWDPEKLSRPAPVAAPPMPEGSDAAAVAAGKHEGLLAAQTKRIRTTPVPSTFKEAEGMGEEANLQAGDAGASTVREEEQEQAVREGAFFYPLVLRGYPAESGGAGSLPAPGERDGSSMERDVGKGAAAVGRAGSEEGHKHAAGVSEGHAAEPREHANGSDKVGASAKRETSAPADRTLPEANRAFGRPRAPLHTGSAASASAAGAAPDKAAEGAAARTGGNEQECSEPAAARAAGTGSAPRSNGGGRSSSAAAGGRPVGLGALGSPAGKLFGAAVRQLQRRSHG